MDLFHGGLQTIHVKPGSIVVPGLAGACINASHIIPDTYQIISDAHAHVLEYGFKMQLQLDGSTSVDGRRRF